MKKFYAAVIVALLAASPAMAIDFTQPIKAQDGTVPKSDSGSVPTLGKICEDALIASYKDEIDPTTGKEIITPEEKYRRWKLAQKLHGDNVKLSPEDLALIKKLVGKAYGPLIVGQAWTMLDPSLDDGK